MLSHDSVKPRIDRLSKSVVQCDRTKSTLTDCGQPGFILKCRSIRGRLLHQLTTTYVSSFTQCTTTSGETATWVKTSCIYDPSSNYHGQKLTHS